ncbi:MAG: hypothetical protein ACR2PM_02185 [Hyphomicrobiales bacterium]
MIAISPALQHNWDWRAAGNFICGGTGTGLIVFAACAAWLGTPGFEAAALAALAIVGLGLFLVWLEIGRPWRFMNVFRNPATSWMSREAWAAALFFPLGALGAVLGSPALISLAALFGLAFLLCQAHMLRAARGIPTWRDAAILPLIPVTGLTEGAGLLLAAAAMMQGHPQWLAIAVLVLVLWRTVLVLVYAVRLRGRKAPDAAQPGLRTVTAITTLGGGLIPALLIMVPLPDAASAAVAASGLLAAAGGWCLKYMLVCTLAYTQGFAIEHAPARGPVPAGPGMRPGWSR